ncbi:MAG: glycoside hydrolase family 3 N-terminal domain-containing protein, partial [Rhodoluna sp.]
TPKIKKQIRALKKFALHNIEPIISSDEEGGSVQRLRSAIYSLPTARTMGKWSNQKLEKAAFKYGSAMKNLGIDIAFSPVADLSIPGYFIDRNSRSFGKSPTKVSEKALAWAKGLQRAGVMPVIKHWPGHGRAVDTHANPGRLPELSILEKSDLIPFNNAIAAGINAVMVGHLIAKDLTEAKIPASRSPKALQILRNQIGNDSLIFTDSLSMGGATKGLHKNISEAAIKSLAAGTDVALVCTPPKSLITDVTKAINSGRLSREAMIDKAKRILLWKNRLARQR